MGRESVDGAGGGERGTLTPSTTDVTSVIVVLSVAIILRSLPAESRRQPYRAHAAARTHVLINCSRCLKVLPCKDFQRALATRAGQERRTGLSLIIKRSYGGLKKVLFMPSAFAPDGEKNKASQENGCRRRSGRITDVDQVGVRLQANQHERRRRRRWQTRHEERGDFDGEGLGADDEGRVARERGGRRGVVHLVPLRIRRVHVFVQRRQV